VTRLELPPLDPAQLRAAAEDGDEDAAAYLNQPYRFSVQSPIELALVQAIVHAARARSVPEVYEDQRDLFVLVGRSWFRVETQARVDRYVADILLTEQDGELRVVVECDGHEFHDRTKEQAQHDRRRDRFLQAEGYRVLRFTGSEIFRGADEAAAEVLGAVAQMAGR
jgi:very-short-patch-repair endonuclease